MKMSSEHVGLLIQIDKNDERSHYRVALSTAPRADSCWLPARSLRLSDPNQPIPRPKEPENEECCGSDCPNCVWIQYWERLQDYERRVSDPIDKSVIESS
ncbi:hypothetical protein TeGR_g761 [Tetraparma gracilis]|uniref:Oxidoreductase-like domain-containing protein n=1 Tax=Tetraparma gracilis TaxID=2962635 RepID=A0ABQ6M7M0_9STRA|nr:hypothetical protein TeGR_g761 [Tetraparma gracilis]